MTGSTERSLSVYWKFLEIQKEGAEDPWGLLVNAGDLGSVGGVLPGCAKQNHQTSSGNSRGKTAVLCLVSSFRAGTLGSQENAGMGSKPGQSFNSLALLSQGIQSQQLQ